MAANATFPATQRGRILSLASGSEVLIPKIPSKSVLRRSYVASNSSSTINSSSELDLSCKLSSDFLYNNHNINISESTDSFQDSKKISLTDSVGLNFSLSENIDISKNTRSSSLVESSSSNDSLNELDLTEGEGLSSGTQIFGLENSSFNSPATSGDSLVDQNIFLGSKKTLKDKTHISKKPVNSSFDEVRKKFMKQDSQKSDNTNRPKIPTRIKKLHSPFYNDSSDKQETVCNSSSLDDINSSSNTVTQRLKDSIYNPDSNILLTSTDSFSSQKGEKNDSSIDLVTSALNNNIASFSSQTSDSNENRDLVIEPDVVLMKTIGVSFPQSISPSEAKEPNIEKESSIFEDTSVSFSSRIVDSSEVKNLVELEAIALDASNNISPQTADSKQIEEPIAEKDGVALNAFDGTLTPQSCSSELKDSDINLGGIASLDGVDFFPRNGDLEETKDFTEKDLKGTDTGCYSFSSRNTGPIDIVNSDINLVSDVIDRTGGLSSQNAVTSETKDHLESVFDSKDNDGGSSVSMIDKHIKPNKAFSLPPVSSPRLPESFQESNTLANTHELNSYRPPLSTSKKSSLCLSNIETDIFVLSEKDHQATGQKSKLVSYLEAGSLASAPINTERNSDSGFQELLEDDFSDVVSEGSDFDEKVEICTLKKTEIFSCVSANRTSSSESQFVLSNSQRGNKIFSVTKFEEISHSLGDASEESVESKSKFDSTKDYIESLNITSPTSHISHESNSKNSLNSQSSGNSQRSEGSFMNKVKGLYDSFRTRNEGYFSSVNYMDTKSLATATSKAPAPLNLNYDFPRSLLNIHFSEKRPVKGPVKGVQLQKIPSHLRRISLLDTCSFNSPSSPVDSLHSFEELNAENIDWEFWGQLVSGFEDMMKKNYLVLRRSIRQGIPVSMRGLVWELLAEIKDTDLVTIYTNLLTKTSPHEKTIIKDLSLTFPKLPYFKAKEGTVSLYNVLKCYSLYDPEVGYCQGLSFLAGPLLLNMPDEEAFCVLVRIMESLRQHFTPAMEGLQVRTYQFERLMEEVIPQVFNHFQEQGIASTMYASQWFISLFAYSSSMRLVFRVLDILLLEGSDILIKVALALLRDNADLILSKNSDELVSYLKFEIFEQYHNQSDHIIAMACDQKLSERCMNKWCKEYMSELVKKAEEAAYASSLQGKNDQLVLANRNLVIQLDHAAASNKEMSIRLLQLQDAYSSQLRENSNLQLKLNELELLLHTERQRAEVALQEQLNTLAQKNLALVVKNAELEDTLLQFEDSISQLKNNSSF